MTSAAPELPAEVQATLRRAGRLEVWTIVWLVAIIAAMSVAAGGSQAFRTALFEDILSVLPPVFFLVSRRLEGRAPTEKYPYGFDRAGSLAFFFAATALALVGLYLLYEGGKVLVTAEHPSVGAFTAFGVAVWGGWVMIGVLIFSAIPPVILGRMKRRVARELHDHVLFTDAEMNAADWRTAAAGVAGVLGVAFGLWWADALMAVLISFSVLKDGVDGLRLSFASLLDGAPRALESDDVDPVARALADTLAAQYGEVNVQVRETGRYMRASIEPRGEPHIPPALARRLMPEAPWRLIEVNRAIHGEPSKEGER